MGEWVTVEDCQGQRDAGMRGGAGWDEKEEEGGYSMWLIPNRRQESLCLSSDLSVGGGWD